MTVAGFTGTSHISRDNAAEQLQTDCTKVFLTLCPQLHRGLSWTSQLKDLLKLSHGKVLKSCNLA